MDAILLGAISLDIYTDSGLILPGGSCLHVAYHLRCLQSPFRLLTRIGQDQPSIFLEFLERHQIAYLPDSIVGEGVSAAIDIAILPDGQPYMDNVGAGVWTDFRAMAVEEKLITEADQIHTVLVEGMIDELERLGSAGLLARPLITADFLDFRHYSLTRMAKTMLWVDVGFIDWPGSLDDDRLVGMRQIAEAQQKLLIITLGSQGVLLFDGRPTAITPVQLFPIQAVPVPGTTVGSGDAFIAYFLAEFWQSQDVVKSILRGKIGGAKAWQWQRPLPDIAYNGL